MPRTSPRPQLNHQQPPQRRVEHRSASHSVTGTLTFGGVVFRRGLIIGPNLLELMRVLTVPSRGPEQSKGLVDDELGSCPVLWFVITFLIITLRTVDSSLRPRISEPPVHLAGLLNLISDINLPDCSKRRGGPALASHTHLSKSVVCGSCISWWTRHTSSPVHSVVLVVAVKAHPAANSTTYEYIDEPGSLPSDTSSSSLGLLRAPW